MGAWMLRGSGGGEMASPVLFALLVFITFCTSFFRLAFNKRFFDHAKQTSGYKYILAKSYYSQFYIGVIFMVLGLTYSCRPEASHAFEYSYIAAGVVALPYLCYPLHEN